MSLLQQREIEVKSRNEERRLAMLETLHKELGRLVPGSVVWVYGSLLVPGGFTEASDVDVAFESIPQLDLYLLQSLLSSAIRCEADVCILSETRMASEIRRTGQKWIV
jgi:predicted nucleotidyltransferase